jgi:hypothetical protein
MCNFDNLASLGSLQRQFYFSCMYFRNSAFLLSLGLQQVAAVVALMCNDA